MEWKQWCRLCGKENGNQVNIFIKTEGLFKMADIIERFFYEIINKEDSSNHICMICNDYLLSLNRYANKVANINQLFIEIESNYKVVPHLNINQLRLKYELEVLETVDEPQISDYNQDYIVKIENLDIDQENVSEQYYPANQSNFTNLKNSENIYEDGTNINMIGHNIANNENTKFNDSKDNHSDLFINSTMNDLFSEKSSTNIDSLENNDIHHEKIKSYIKVKKIKKSNNVNKKNYNFWPCEFCGKVFKEKQLKFHLETHLPAKGSEKLPNKIIENRDTLKFHIKHTCPICNKVLKTRNILKAHMVIHSDERPFNCNICNKNFKRYKNLKTHILTHSNEKPFTCRFCTKSYSDPVYWRRHEKNAH